MISGRYKLIDHTADLGLHLFAPAVEGLYETAAMAMFDQIVDPASVDGQTTADLDIRGEDPADLMVNWLRELLYLWAGEEKLIKTARVHRLSDRDLAATLRFDLFDPRRHDIRGSIKAVTYHQIQVNRVSDGWEAKVIFDV